MSYFLSCNPLQSNECSVGDYVIEWRLNARDGEIVFVSGKGSDPAIQAQHPLVNEVVFAGTLYPIIRYAYLNSTKYTAEFEEGALHSPDFVTCLDPVVVDEVDCDTVLGSDPNYNYYLSYNNINDVGQDKSRTIKYNISATTQYLAWALRAYDVAEQIKIYYCTLADPTGTLIDNFIIGTRNASGGLLVTNLYPSSYPTNARTYNYSTGYPMPYISDLTSFTYTVGDYIRIEIIGSVLEPANTNTNWILSVQCIESIDDSFYSTDISKIDTLPSGALTFYGDPRCYYDISYNLLEETGNLNAFYRPVNPYFLYRYTDILHSYTYSSNTKSLENGTNPIYLGLRWKTIASISWMVQTIATCVNLGTETISISKSGSDISFIFSDIDDYNVFVADIAAVQADADYTTWLGLSSSDSRYYGYYYIHYIYALSCGDTRTNLYFYIWLGSPISYDEPNKTITFTCTVPTNDISSDTCNTVRSDITSLIVNFNGTIAFNYAPYTPTNVRTTKPVGALWWNTPVLAETSRTTYSYLYIHEALVNNIFDPLSLGFCYDAPTKTYRLYRVDDILTMKTYGTHDQRLYDWKLERRVRLRTDVCTDTAYEIVAEGPGTTTTTTTVAPTTTTTTTTP